MSLLLIMSASAQQICLGFEAKQHHAPACVALCSSWYDYLHEKNEGNWALRICESRRIAHTVLWPKRRTAGHLHIQVRAGTADGSGADKPSKASADNSDIAAVSCSSLPPRAIAVSLIPRAVASGTASRHFISRTCMVDLSHRFRQLKEIAGYISALYML